MPYRPANSRHVRAVRRSLSRVRLGGFDRHARRYGGRGLELYEWNVEASGACHAAIHLVEICLRNAIHARLTRWHGSRGLPGSWIDDPLQELDAHRRADIRAARTRLMRRGKPVTADGVVAELTFGFWRYLLAGRYECTLWTHAIRYGFPYLQPQARRRVAEPVERLHQLRNRVAHHEPIHTRDLMADLWDMWNVLGAICPRTQGWARQHTRLLRAILDKPGLPIPVQRTPLRDGSWT